MQCCDTSSADDTSGRYFHYVNTKVDPLYHDELKLLGWDYINYIDGWPVLSYW